MRSIIALTLTAMMFCASNGYAWRILDFSDPEPERGRPAQPELQEALVDVPSVQFLKDPKVAMKRIQRAGLEPVLVPGDPPARPGQEGQVYTTRPRAGKVTPGSRILIFHHTYETPVDAAGLAEAIANQNVQLARERLQKLGLDPQLIEGVAASSDDQVGRVYQAEAFGGRHQEDRKPTTDPAYGRDNRFAGSLGQGPTPPDVTDYRSRYILHGSRVGLFYYGPVRPMLPGDPDLAAKESMDAQTRVPASASAEEVGNGVSASASAAASAFVHGEGCNDLTGIWIHDTPELTCESTWELYRKEETKLLGPYGAKEHGCCNAGGEARLIGHEGNPRLVIEWTCNQYCRGEYRYDLDSDCQSGEGMIVFNPKNNPPCTENKRTTIMREPPPLEGPGRPGAPGASGHPF